MKAESVPETIGNTPHIRAGRLFRTPQASAFLIGVAVLRRRFQAM